MPAKFEIRKDKAGKFRFNLIAANGEIIASSEAYESRTHARMEYNLLRQTHRPQR
jgi:uncharacterized protein